MKYTIRKYDFLITDDTFEMELPKGSKIIHVAKQYKGKDFDTAQMWILAKFFNLKNLENRKFFVMGIGYDFEETRPIKHIITFFRDSPFHDEKEIVCHLFEIKKRVTKIISNRNY